jgi:DNA-binding response OmpR family regulator
MKRRILLVDDEPMILITLKAILETNHFEVTTAGSSSEAKLKLETGHYHLVITDLKMENDISGFDVVRFARQQRYRPAVALLTAYPPSANASQPQIPDRIWVKPKDTPELLKEIEALLAPKETTTSPETKTSIASQPFQSPPGVTAGQP